MNGGWFFYAFFEVGFLPEREIAEGVTEKRGESRQ